jgi:hypothetical protein
MALPRTTSEESSHPNSSHSKKEHPEIHIAHLPTQSSLLDFPKVRCKFWHLIKNSNLIYYPSSRVDKSHLPLSKDWHSKLMYHTLEKF